MRLGCSSRTLARYVESGKIKAGNRTIPGTGPVKVYCPEDVEQMAKDRPVAQPIAGQIVGPMIAGLSPIQPGQVTELSEPPLFVGIKEASEISGLSQAWFRRMVNEGGFPHIKDGQIIKISRRSLEALSGAAGNAVNAKGTLLLTAASQ